MCATITTDGAFVTCQWLCTLYLWYFVSSVCLSRLATNLLAGSFSRLGRFFQLLNARGGRGKNGLGFIARVIVRMRISITQILGNRIPQ